MPAALVSYDVQARRLTCTEQLEPPPNRSADASLSLAALPQKLTAMEMAVLFTSSQAGQKVAMVETRCYAVGQVSRLGLGL